MSEGRQSGADQLTLQERKSAATRQRLIQAAISCASEYGFGHTNTTMIASSAGVSRGAIQHHFSTRDELFDAALETLSDQALREFGIPLPYRGSLDEYIREIIQAHWNMFTRDSHIFFLEMCLKERDNIRFRKAVKATLEEHTRHYHSWWADMLFPLAVDEETIRKTGMISLGLVRGLLHDYAYTDDREYFDHLLEVVIQRITKMVRKGASHETP